MTGTIGLRVTFRRHLADRCIATAAWETSEASIASACTNMQLAWRFCGPDKLLGK